MPPQPPLISVPPPVAPSVPGAINIPGFQLQGTDIVALAPLGQNSAQTTLFDIAFYILSQGAPRPTITLGMFQPGLLTGSLVIFSYIAPEALNFPANFSTSQANIVSGATGNPVLHIQKNGVDIGTISITGTTATFASTGGLAQKVAIGDVITVVGPASADATLAAISISIFGART